MSQSSDQPVLLTARGAAISYDGVSAALSDLDFRIDAGQLVALLGPNGGGKTTLLRGLIGELEVSVGDLTVVGGFAYLPQLDRTRLDFPVTALDVAAMGALARTPWWRPGGRAVRNEARLALTRVGLADHADKQFGELSGGQRRRVLLARTLMQNARVIALDEPYAGVDPASASVIDRLLGELRDEGHTILLATHDIEQAKAADLVLCLNRRQITFGPPANVLDRSALQATYGHELMLLDGGPGEAPVIAVQHHHHHDH